jgi:hypothetical protein
MQQGAFYKQFCSGAAQYCVLDTRVRSSSNIARPSPGRRTAVIVKSAATWAKNVNPIAHSDGQKLRTDSCWSAIYLALLSIHLLNLAPIRSLTGQLGVQEGIFTFHKGIRQ